MTAARRLFASIVPRRLRPMLRSMLSTAERGPSISHTERVVGLDRLRSLDATARLTILDAESAPSSGISFGRDVYIGRQVEITAAHGGRIDIDDDTSIQDSSIVFGDVRIGAHCLFGKYVFVASRGHSFRLRPPWLIRDQDDLAQQSLPLPSELETMQVRIEEDCWIAQSVVVSPGIYIGRGAVIGANTVVTRDIAPYEVHAGAPNRKIGTRLDFAPPLTVDAKDDRAIPYFYRGFDLRQSSLAESRRRAIVAARDRVSIVLAGLSSTCVSISGRRMDAAGELALQLRINGRDCGRHQAASETFEIRAAIPEEDSVVRRTSVPRLFRDYTYVEIDVVPAEAPEPRYGIANVRLVGAQC